jgi:hypothetical protein
MYTSGVQKPVLNVVLNAGLYAHNVYNVYKTGDYLIRPHTLSTYIVHVRSPRTFSVYVCVLKICSGGFMETYV